MRVTGLDHVVLLCADVEASIGWYCGVLGLEGVDVERWRDGEAFFPSVRVNGDTIIDLLASAPDGRNTDHLCLVLEPTDLHVLAAREDLDVIEGPVQRGGAHGQGWSVYVRDPDGYVVELKHYGSDPSGEPNGAR